MAFQTRRPRRKTGEIQVRLNMSMRMKWLHRVTPYLTHKQLRAANVLAFRQINCAGVWNSTGSLAAESGLSKNHFYEATRELADGGFISVRKHTNGKRCLAINITWHPEVREVA